MKLERLVILGAGSCGRTVLAATGGIPRELHYEFLDDSRAGQHVDGVLVSGPTSLAYEDGHGAPGLGFVVAFGNQFMRQRREAYARLLELQRALATVVHPSVSRAQNVDIGAGCVVAPGCVFQPGAILGNNSFLCGLVNVDHDCCIGDNACIGPGAVFCGNVTLAPDVVVGGGVVVLPGRHVGRGAILGAGAVVTHDVPAFAVAAGNPARIMRQGAPW